MEGSTNLEGLMSAMKIMKPTARQARLSMQNNGSKESSFDLDFILRLQGAESEDLVWIASSERRVPPS